MQNGQVAALPP